MKRLNYFLIMPVIFLAVLIRCNKDKDDPPSIIGWLDTFTAEVGDTSIINYLLVSPSDEATFEWFLNNVSVSDSLVFQHVFTEIGEYDLKFQVTRFNAVNSREAKVIAVKTIKLVCGESGWRIEGEDGSVHSVSESWNIWDDSRGWVYMRDVTLTFENSGNIYEVHIESWQVFIEGEGIVQYNIITATGGSFGTDTVNCSYP